MVTRVLASGNCERPFVETERQVIGIVCERWSFYFSETRSVTMEDKIKVGWNRNVRS